MSTVFQISDGHSSCATSVRDWRFFEGSQLQRFAPRSRLARAQCEGDATFRSAGKRTRSCGVDIAGITRSQQVIDAAETTVDAWRSVISQVVS